MLCYSFTKQHTGYQQEKFYSLKVEKKGQSKWNISFQIVRLDLGTFYATSSFKSTYKPFCIWTMQLPQFGIDNHKNDFLVN